MQQKYLKLLSRQFPTIQDASREIINLEAILNLPKGTEHFLSDVHGENEAFLHILKSGSGVIRRKIEDIFGANVTQKEKNSLATLIYYPHEVLKKIQGLSISQELQGNTQSIVQNQADLEDYYEVTLHRLVLVCREVSSKYTRSKVRKALPEEFRYIIEELLHEKENESNKFQYYDKIIKTIIEIGQAQPFISAISEVIQRLSIDHLHIIGDIYDRGSGVHIIMDKLMKYHSVDIQWGNHDMVWMGANAGSLLCIANAIRISARYGNLDLLEEAYGINLLPLAKFAIETYPEVEDTFLPRTKDRFMPQEIHMIAQIHKAITIIMFKLEEQFIKRNSHFDMEDRLLLSKVDFNHYTIELQNNKMALHEVGESDKSVVHSLNCQSFPTVNVADPNQLSALEMEVMLKLKSSFVNNEKLNSHVEFLLSKGSIYLVFNNNLLYHGCIPLTPEGDFAELELGGHIYKGKDLLDQFEKMVRETYGKRFELVSEAQLDIFWYLWTGEYSSLFGKKAMKTFERYFLADVETHKEEKNAYYTVMEEERYCDKIMKEFGLDPAHAKIMNGHVPVKVNKGESPVKANGKLIVIDGGLAKPYQKVTGIAGYTLISNSFGMLLAAHEPFKSAKDSIDNGTDIVSSLTILENNNKRIRVSDTDIGKKLQEDIDDLKLLLEAYQLGLLK